VVEKEARDGSLPGPLAGNGGRKKTDPPVEGITGGSFGEDGKPFQTAPDGTGAVWNA